MRICDLCGKQNTGHRWLTTHEYEQTHKKFCLRTEGTFWVDVPKDWEPKFLLDELKEKAPDNPCDEDFMRAIST